MGSALEQLSGILNVCKVIQPSNTDLGVQAYDTHEIESKLLAQVQSTADALTNTK